MNSRRLLRPPQSHRRRAEDFSGMARMNSNFATRTACPQLCGPSFATRTACPQLCGPSFATRTACPQLCGPSFATQRTYLLSQMTVRYANCLHIPYDLLCHCVIPCSRIPSRCFFAPYPLFPRKAYISSSIGYWSHNFSI